MSHGLSKTFSPANEFKFVCPVFGAEVKLADCNSLNNQWMRGQGPEVRKGCQACMSSSKCPMIWVIREVDFKTNSDPYYSSEPRVGKLSDFVMKAIAPIVTSDHTLNHPAYVSMLPRHRELITEVNGIDGFKHLKGMKGVTLEDIGVRIRPDSPQKYTKAAAPKPASKNHESATTGDMSAAINAAMESSKEKDAA